MLLCHFKYSFKKDKLNFRFIGTLNGKKDENSYSEFHVFAFNSSMVMRTQFDDRKSVKLRGTVFILFTAEYFPSL